MAGSRSAVALLCVFAVAGVSSASFGMRTSSRPLGRSARAFADSLRGNDINLPTFLAAARAYCDLVGHFGSFAAPSSSEVRRCLAKIEQGIQKLAHSGGRRRVRIGRIQSMKALLQAEAAVEGLHKPKGMIADPSAAIGLLWARRALHYWVEAFDEHAHHSGSLLDELLIAYERSLAKFHGWIARRASMMASQAAPTWEDVRTNAKLAPSDAAMRDDMRNWANSVRKVVKCMHALHVKFDMEDTRKCV